MRCAVALAMLLVSSPSFADYSGDPQKAPLDLGPPVVRQLAKGRAPQSIRFQVPAKKTVRTQAMMLKSQMSFRGGESVPTAPTFKVTLETIIEPDGAFTVSVRDLVTVPPPSPNADFVRGVEDAMAPLRDASCRGTLTTSGATGLACGTDKILRQQLELTTLTLPEFPLGEGTKWEIVKAVGGGMITRFRTTYEVQSIKGKRIRINVRSTMSKDPGGGRFAQPDGTIYQMLDAKMSLSAMIEFDLAQPLPAVAKLTSDTQMSSYRERDGKREPLDVKTVIDAVIEEKK